MIFFVKIQKKKIINFLKLLSSFASNRSIFFDRETLTEILDSRLDRFTSDHIFFFVQNFAIEVDGTRLAYRRCQGPASSSVIAERLSSSKQEGGRCRVKGLYVSLRKKNADPLGPGQARPCHGNPRLTISNNSHWHRSFILSLPLSFLRFLNRILRWQIESYAIHGEI